jgi:DNA-binding response OmpR family regulator
MSPSILLVEDSSTIRAFVIAALEMAGHDVVAAADGEAGIQRFLERRPDVVVLDISLPQMDGWQVLERIRELDERVPVLMLTGQDSERDKVRGLVSGADDYVAKPSGAAELRARIAALLRRARLAERPQPADAAPAVYDDGRLRIDHAACRVEVEGIEVALTPVEFRLLQAFARHPGIVLSREDLLEQAWQDYGGGPGEQVKVYVGYLRRKLASATDREIIETVRGFGYRLVSPETPAGP